MAKRPNVEVLPTTNLNLSVFSAGPTLGTGRFFSVAAKWDQNRSGWLAEVNLVTDQSALTPEGAAALLVPVMQKFIDAIAEDQAVKE
jgi:hypothetical protein